MPKVASRTCQRCKGVLPSVEALYQHERKFREGGTCRSIRGVGSKSHGIMKNKERTFPCSVCKLNLKTNAALRKHKITYETTGNCPPLKNRINYSNFKKKNGITYWYCDFCPGEFTSTNSLKAHVLKFRKTGSCPPFLKIKPNPIVEELQCQNCHSKFSTLAGYKLHMQNFENENKCRNVKRTYEVTSIRGADGTPLYPCPNCGDFLETVDHWRAHRFRMKDGKCPAVKLLRRHLYLQPFVKERMKKVHPFQFVEDEIYRDEPYIEDSLEFVQALEFTMKWIAAYKEDDHRKYSKGFHGVYIVAVLGPNYKKGMDCRDFMESNPSQVLGIYVGSTTGSTSGISRRHVDTPQSSILARAALSGYTVVLLQQIKVPDIKDRLQEVKTEEARIIGKLLTDAEYTPIVGVPQYPILNKNKETHHLRYLEEKYKKPMYSSPIYGFPTICFDELCNGSTCRCYVRPNWKGNLILDLKQQILEKHGNLKLETFIPEKINCNSKLQRPISKVELETETNRRMDELKTFLDEYDRRHYLYTVIVVPEAEFPRGWTAKKMCKELIKRKDNDLTVGLYFGINGRPTPADHHFNDNQIHSGIFKAKEKGGIPILIEIDEFKEKVHAQFREATLIAFHMLKQRFQVTGVKFELLNEKMEWEHLRSGEGYDEEFKYWMGLALCGLPTIGLDGKECAVDLTSCLPNVKKLYV